jgi:hypothetical protein
MTSRIWIVFLTGVAGCNGDPIPGAPCPEVGGEFPPTACAYVEGRLSAAGTPLQEPDFESGTMVDTSRAELTLP